MKRGRVKAVCSSSRSLVPSAEEADRLRVSPFPLGKGDGRGIGETLCPESADGQRYSAVCGAHEHKKEPGGEA